MKPYLDMLRDVRTRGRLKKQRAVLASSGQRPECLSLFGLQARYDLREGFPLVTTRKVSFHVVKAELSWMLSGSTSVRPLQEQGVHIWDQWADAKGELGPVYGACWRHWPATTAFDGSLLSGYPDRNSLAWDQIRWLQDHMRLAKNDPEHPCARRLILSAWNPPEASSCKGPPACHTLAQWDVHEGELSCHLYQRSADLFLGVPYNVASYALLTHLFARGAGLEVDELIHSFGDAHVYSNHQGAVDEQLTRQPLPSPRLVLAEQITDIDVLKPEWITLEGYQCHPPLKGEVAV